jgi:hypothetical protein
MALAVDYISAAVMLLLLLQTHASTRWGQNIKGGARQPREHPILLDSEQVPVRWDMVLCMISRGVECTCARCEGLTQKDIQELLSGNTMSTC